MIVPGELRQRQPERLQAAGVGGRISIALWSGGSDSQIEVLRTEGAERLVVIAPVLRKG